MNILVPTFLRHRTARFMLRRIQRLHPEARIIVANDHHKPFRMEGVDVIQMPYNSGLSACRNRLVQEADEGVVVLMDDDWWLPSAATISRLIEGLRCADVATGRMVRLTPGGLRDHEYHGQFTQHGTHLFIDQDGAAIDLSDNFIAADRQTLLDHPWDQGLKNGEHLPWFVDLWLAGVHVHRDVEAVVYDVGKLLPRPLRGTYWRHRARSPDRCSHGLRERGIESHSFHRGRLPSTYVGTRDRSPAEADALVIGGRA